MLFLKVSIRELVSVVVQLYLTVTRLREAVEQRFFVNSWRSETKQQLNCVCTESASLGFHGNSFSFICSLTLFLCF